jgi:hypothetical protein
VHPGLQRARVLLRHPERPDRQPRPHGLRLHNGGGSNGGGVRRWREPEGAMAAGGDHTAVSHVIGAPWLVNGGHGASFRAARTIDTASGWKAAAAWASSAQAGSKLSLSSSRWYDW